MENQGQIYGDTLQWDGVANIDSNLIYMTADGQEVHIEDLIEEDVTEEVEVVPGNVVQFQDCEIVTEEVVTDDWGQGIGNESVIQVTVDQVSGGPNQDEDNEIRLPIDNQDEYTASRPYPCDFCSRRFRKKANLMNHMIAHQNDRPHVCNLCGARYIRKSDLLNHLKTHAYQEDGYVEEEEQDLVNYITQEIPDAKSAIHFEKLLSSSASRKQARLPVRPAPKKKNRLPAKQFSQKQVEPKIKYISNDPKKPYVCQCCGVTFARSTALQAHTQLHVKKESLECHLCGEQLWDSASFKKHKQQHLMDQQRSLGGSVDDEATDSETEVQNMQDPVYGCTECPKSFQDLKSQTMHIQMHFEQQEESKLHCCYECGETFDEALELLAHAELHARTLTHECAICSDRFSEASTLKLHINEVHRHQLTETTCRVCGKEFKDGRALLRHSWDHSQETSHSCSRCAKTFLNKARLKRHMLSHKNKTVRCEDCGENLPDGRSLLNHRHAHSKTMQFRCDDCGKTFGSRSSQQIHQRIHTGERPYGCKYCWKAFADGGTLRKHERIHTGEKPYICPVCSRAFNQRVVLRDHIRSHHSAPDLKFGSLVEPYYCTVCSETYSTSSELIRHLVQHSDHLTQSRRQPTSGPRRYKRRRTRSSHTATLSRKDVEEEIATYAFRKSVPTTSEVVHEDFKIPREILEVVRDVKPNLRLLIRDGPQTREKRLKAPKLEDIVIKSENFPLLDDGKPLQEPKGAEVDFFAENLIDKFNPDIVNDLKEILQSPMKYERSDGRPRRSVRPTLKCLESQAQERDLKKLGGARTEENRCQICGIVFSNRQNLVSHVQVHI